MFQDFWHARVTDAIEHIVALPVGRHQALVRQALQLIGDGLDLQAQGRGQIPYPDFTGPDQGVQQPQTVGIGEYLEKAGELLAFPRRH